MNITYKLPSEEKVLMSGNEAVGGAVWEAVVRVECAYPVTRSTEILEKLET